MNKNKIVVIATLVLAFILISVSVFNVYAATCVYSLFVEGIAQSISMAFAITILNIFLIVTYFFRRNETNIVCTVCLVPLVVISVYTSSRREFDLDRKYWQFEGRVTRKYNSDNHGAKTITVNGIDYEFIPPAFWNSIKVGDTVKKLPCNDTAIVNGNEVSFFK